MTNTQTLSLVALDTLKNVRAASRQAVVAYRLSSRKLVSAINRALIARVYPLTAKLAPAATERVNGLRGSVSGFVEKSIDQVADRAGQAIDFGSTTAASQVTRAAELAAAIRNGTVAGGVQAAAGLYLPGAKAALALSGKVAQGANALADAAGVRPVRKAVRRTTAGAKRAGTQAARKAKAPVAKARRAARRAVKAQ